jgi:hypothetical protein
VSQHLAHEERVAVGLAIYGVGEAHAGVVEAVGGSRLHERHHASVIETRKLDPRHTGVSSEHPQGLSQGIGFGQLAVAVRPEYQHRHRGVGRHEVTQQEQAPPVGPLEVVEHEDHGLVRRHRAQQRHRGCEQQIALGVGVGCLRRREIGDPAGEGRGEAGQFGSVVIGVGAELVLGRVGDVVTESLSEELIGGGEVLLTVTEQHAGAIVERVPSNLGDEGGLAQPGLAREEERLQPCSSGDTFEGVHDRGHLGAATDHPHGGAHGQTCGQWDRSRIGPGERLPEHLDRLDGAGKTLQSQLPERPALMTATPTRHQPDHLARQDLTAFALRAQPGRLDHRVPEVVVVLPADLPPAQADPQTHRVPEATVVSFDALLHGHRARQRRRGQTEDHHQPVPEALHLDSPLRRGPGAGQ